MASRRRMLSLVLVSVILLLVIAAKGQEDDGFHFHAFDNFDFPLDANIPFITFPPQTADSPLSSPAFPPPTAERPQNPLPPENPSPPIIPYLPAPQTPPAPATPSTPETPLPPQIPIPPVTPDLPPPEGGTTCEDKCVLKCSVLSFMYKGCLILCKLKCSIQLTEKHYLCTDQCANSMPLSLSLSYDEQSMESYVNSCFEECKRKN